MVPLEPIYDTQSRYGRWALDRERRKLRYVHLWAARRGLRLTAARVRVRVRHLWQGAETAWAYLTQTLGLEYAYADRPHAVNRIGIGTRHTVQLVRRDGRWLIRRDWFTDPLGEDTVIPDVTPACGPAHGGIPLPAPGRETAADAGSPAPPLRAPYRRAAAVAYADRYCGAAWGCGNGNAYNARYRDYTDRGGDCTNFVSQVLGDPQGGALPMDAVWYADLAQGGAGSRAWVQSEAFLDHLLSTGRGALLFRGTFTEVTSPGERHPRGAVRALRPGDLIAYEEKGRVEHLAVVVGADARGYPLVDSHTADRYHVPWDLGWDRATRFWLIKVRD